MNAVRMACKFIAILVVCYWLSAIEPAAAGGADDAKNKIKDMQKQRLEALTVARDDLVRQWKADDLASAVNTNGFTHQLLEANKLVDQARLDLCDSKPERIKVIEDSIMQFEPILAIFEKHYKARIVDSTAPYHLALAHLLDLKIALEKSR